MRLLNAQSSAGAVVRAVKLRHDKGQKRSTIQYHTEAALKRWDMHIKCAGLQNGEGIAEIDEQIEEDIKTADACTKLGITIHAFGDRATWDKEGISGWGIQLQRWGGGHRRPWQDPWCPTG